LKSDAELSEAASELGTYLDEAEQVIRSELRRRGLPEPTSSEMARQEAGRSGGSLEPGTAVLLALLFGTLGLAYVRGWGVALQATAVFVVLILAIGWIVPEALLVVVPGAWIGIPIYAYNVAKQESYAAAEAATRCPDCGMAPPDHQSWCVSGSTQG